MIIVEVGGGLGNQMFCYMLYLALKQRRDDVKFSYFSFSQYKHTLPHASKYLLPDIFTMNDVDYATDKEVRIVAGWKPNIFSKAYRLLVRRILKIPKKTQIYVNRLKNVEHIWEQTSLTHRIKQKFGIAPSPMHHGSDLVQRQFEEIVSAKSMYLTGFFGDFGYTKDIEGKVRSELTFKKPLDDKNRLIAQQMSGGGDLRFSARQARRLPSVV